MFRRSVRHINDYACVLLLDERYGSPKIQAKLPNWIKRGVCQTETFRLLQGMICKIF